MDCTVSSCYCMKGRLVYSNSKDYRSVEIWSPDIQRWIPKTCPNTVSSEPDGRVFSLDCGEWCPGCQIAEDVQGCYLILACSHCGFTSMSLEQEEEAQNGSLS